MKTLAWYVATSCGVVGMLFAGCASDVGKPAAEGADASATIAPAHAAPSLIADSPASQARVEAVRARFVLPVVPPLHAPWQRGARSPTEPRPLLGRDVASGFALSDGSLHPVMAPDEKRGVRTARVALPLRANDPVRIADDTSNVAVSFALMGESETDATTAGGVALYPGALAGADVLYRVHSEGVEDYVVFEARPAKEEIAYDVDVSRVAGLRLVSNTLELLDDGGAPRLRVAPPYAVDTEGVTSEAVLALEGCAFDTNASAPQGRAVTPPGASRCTVRVSWRAASYPAILDPSWTATGSMTTARYFHTAALLGSGKVLVAGGTCGAGMGCAGETSSAEIYDPTSGSFAVTGSMTKVREQHTATLLANGHVLVTGGNDATAELYDPTAGTFTLTGGAMTAARFLHTATLLGSGKVLVVGGRDSGVLASAEVYDPVAGVFAATASMTLPRYVHVAALLGSGTVLIAGGAYDSAGDATATAEVYDPAAASFTATGSMATARYWPGATTLASGKVLVAAGGDSSQLSSVELYDPVAATFSTTGSLATARWSPTVTRLVAGQVLVAGGGSAAAELYDPVAATFGTTAAMITARDYDTATLLGSGEVLAAGGEGAAALSSAELFGCITTCPAGNNCGTIPDGCGGTVNCGTCALPQTCGGAGTAGQCGCTSTGTCANGNTCGVGVDNCGNTIACGTCTGAQTCGGGGVASQCGCTPIAECPAGDNCGAVPDECGGILQCGTCTTGQTCTSSNHCVSTTVDAGGGQDARARSDGGGDADSGNAADTGTADSATADAGGQDAATDSGGVNDAGAGRDSGATPDSGHASDPGGKADARTFDSGKVGATDGTANATQSEAGMDAGNAGAGNNSGCGCRVVRVEESGSSPALLAFGGLALVCAMRRRRRGDERRFMPVGGPR